VATTAVAGEAAVTMATDSPPLERALDERPGDDLGLIEVVAGALAVGL